VRELGITSIRPIESSDDPVATVLPITSVRAILGFSQQLDRAVSDNVKKVGEALGLAHHLGVLVDRFDASAFADLTPVPDLPTEVDVLWVLHKWRHSEERLQTWVGRRDAQAWTFFHDR
jgi:hypothetical protein